MHCCASSRCPGTLTGFALPGLPYPRALRTHMLMALRPKDHTTIYFGLSEPQGFRQSFTIECFRIHTGSIPIGSKVVPFWGYKILNTNHNKELLWSLWLHAN